MVKEIFTKKPIISKELWLKDKANYLSSTEMATLFGLSKFNKSVLELWDRKKAKRAEESFDGNAVMLRGKHYEEPIARNISRLKGYKNVEPINELVIWEEKRLCCSFDFVINGEKDNSKCSIFEIKSVNPFHFKSAWNVVDGVLLEAPNHIEMQLQFQLMFCEAFGATEGKIGVGIGYEDQDHYVLERSPNEKVKQAILEKAEWFWNSIDKNERPDINYDTDHSYLKEQIVKTKPQSVIASSKSIDKVAQEYKSILEKEKDLKKQKQIAQTKVLQYLGKNEKVVGEWGSFTSKYHDKKEKWIDPKAGYFRKDKAKRTFSVNFKKEQK